MSTKSEKDRAKQIQDKCQTVLNNLLRDEDNKYCVDCDSKGPRWASWNLGVFLCIRCAGIHRNLGVHISKVKSVNLDTWTPEQVVSLQQMGNSRARAVYEANLPDNFRRPQSDSSLESFIRAKYEQKKYIAREWVPPTIPKVNWEKEIDEELERQKRKKKSNMEQKKPLSITEVPQIPKPRNSASPKPNRITTQTTQTETKSSAGTDLLGLQNGEDNFTSFLSAPKKDEPSIGSQQQQQPQQQQSKQDDTETIKSEEESFFNQPAPTEKEKAKLTKDSILALYGSAPQTNFPLANPNYQPTQFQQQNFTNFAQNFPIQQQNGSHATQQPVVQPAQFQQQPAMLNQFAQLNQFAATGNAQQQQMQFQPMFQGMGQQPQQQQQFAMTNQFALANTTQFPNQFQGMGQFQQTAQFHQQQPQFNVAAAPMQQPMPQQQQQNPFFGNPVANMQHQFNSMSLTSVPVAKQGTAPVASNVWQ